MFNYADQQRVSELQRYRLLYMISDIFLFVSFLLVLTFK